MMRNTYERYREAQAMTAPAAELTLMLYRGALKFLAQATSAIDRRDIQGAHTSLVRCQSILEELRMSLDPSAGPVAQSLSTLYAYMIERLVLANLKKDRAPAEEVQDLLRTLLTAWEEATAAGARTPGRTEVGGSYVRVS